METEVVSDGVLAENQTQIQELWSWREGITECLGHDGGVYKYDLSIPISELYDLVNETRDRLTEAGLLGSDASHPVVDVVGYGHMGDANLHLNIPVRKFDKAVEKKLEPFVYEWVQKRNGSISAEHGLGVTKKPYIGYSKSETMIKLMKQIKDLYDPVSSCPTSSYSQHMLTSLERYHEPIQVHIEACCCALSRPFIYTFLPASLSFVLYFGQQFFCITMVDCCSLVLSKQIFQPIFHPLSKCLHVLRLRKRKVTSVQQPFM
jgi:hypothetical protein